MNNSSVYLDFAAATPMDARVLDAMQPYFTERFYNPSATYLAAKAVGKDLEQARAGVASVLGARPAEIIFTAGGTEANNLAVMGMMKKYPDANVVVSAIEHESVLASAHQFDAREVQVDEKGSVKLDDLRAKIDEKTALVSVMYANNEVGTIQPIREIAALIKEVRDQRRKAGNKLPLYFHTDAAQAANYLDLQAARLGVDLLTLNGGKIYGPKQSGILFVSAGVELVPLILGGGQERNLRSGTENVAACIGFACALQITHEMRTKEVKRLSDLQAYFFKQLEEKLPQAIVNGSQKKRLPNNVHITIPEIDNERVLIKLDESGIVAAAGSACSASGEEPSHVLKAMGLSNEDAQASLRFSMGRTTTKADVGRVIEQLVRAI